jgi:cell division septation protein DedD
VAERYGYPADFAKIRELLRSIWELKYVRELEVGPSQLGRLQLLPAGQGDQSGAQIDLLGTGDKKIAALILGKKPSSGESGADSGRFALNPDQKDHVYLIDETFPSVDPLNPSGWLNKQFIDTQKLRTVVRGNTGNAPGWKVSRKDEHADWQLQDAAPNESLEKENANPLSSLSVSIQDVRPENAPVSETGLQQPLLVELDTFDGFHYQLEIGGAGPEQTHFLRVKVRANFPAARTPAPDEKAEEQSKKDDEFNKQLEQWKIRLANEQKLEHWIFLVSDWSLDPLLKGRADFVKKTESSPTPQAAAPTPTAASPTPTVTSPTPANTSGANPSSRPEASATPK